MSDLIAQARKFHELPKAMRGSAMSRLLLFLGAGASQPLGIPTMVKMVELIADRLEGDEEELFGSVLKAISRRGMRTDIEAILSVVQSISAGHTAFDLGYPVAYLVKEVHGRNAHDTISGGRREQKVAVQLLEQIQTHIRELCSPEDLRNREPRILEPYSDLFARLASIPEVNPFALGDGTKVPDAAIFTTNYDLALETFFHEHRHPIPDLFDRGSEATPKLARAGSVGSGAHPRLVKLHGSLNWFLLDSGEVVQDPVGPGHITGRRNLGHVLLYPIQQKDLYLYPWMDLYWLFRKDLRDAKDWVFVGYRFGDEFLTAVVREALLDSPASRAFVFGPRAVDSRTTLMGGHEELESRVESVKGYFGNTDDHERLARAISPNDPGVDL